MTTAWLLLLLLLLLIVSSQNVDSQSTTDCDQVCDGEHLSELKEDVNKLKNDMQRMLENQQQFFHTIINRLGKL